MIGDGARSERCAVTEGCRSRRRFTASHASAAHLKGRAAGYTAAAGRDFNGALCMSDECVENACSFLSNTWPALLFTCDSE